MLPVVRLSAGGGVRLGNRIHNSSWTSSSLSAVSSTIWTSQDDRTERGSVSHFSSSSNNQNNTSGGGGGSFASGGRSSTLRSTSFQPRRRPPKTYRPFVPKRVGKIDSERGRPAVRIDLEKDCKLAKTELERKFGVAHAEEARELQRKHAIYEQDEFGLYNETEEDLRMMDNQATEPGTTEESIYERRVMEQFTEEEQKDLDKEIRETHKWMEDYWQDFEDDSDYRKLKPPPKKKMELMREAMGPQEDVLMTAMDEDDPDQRFDPNARVHGLWSEYIVAVKRGNHNWRGGRVESYRAMVVGGNGNGCAGFGVGKAKTAMKAVELAGRESRRNVFFANRYQGYRFTHDLVGRHNSCKVFIRENRKGMKGNILMREILYRFGITRGTCKAIGNRSPWNVVYATFKAVLLHESIEDIALKRGKRFVAVDKAARVQV